MVAVSISSTGDGGNVHKILVVDDERHIVRLVQVNLERAGYNVVCAFTAQEAIEKIASEQPDFLIVDVTLPDVDGYTLTRRIRENPDFIEVPVLLFIPRDTPEEVNKVQVAGADYYLLKPFPPLELLRIVRCA